MDKEKKEPVPQERKLPHGPLEPDELDALLDLMKQYNKPKVPDEAYWSYWYGC